MPTRNILFSRAVLLLTVALAVSFAVSGALVAARSGAAGPSLECMAGQMIMSGFRGTGEGEVSGDLAILLEDAREGRIGGVILFDKDALTQETGRNVTSLEQVTRLVRVLQESASCPLFIGVDQEGGRVQRLKEEHGGLAHPSAAELGNGTIEATRAEAERMGRLLRSVGINLNFAPSLDVNVNPESPAIGALGRSFSANPQTVAEHGRAFARGLSSSGIIACYKHFPGHGSAADDTHLGLTDITVSWQRDELTPYRLILPGSPPAMVMPGHMVHKEKTGDLPASLSPAVIGGMLRKELDWKGVVITDDLQMQAIEGRYSTKEALRLAVLAGADILLLGNNLRHDPKEARKAHALLLELVHEGAITEERIAESYARIIRLKQEAGLFGQRVN